MLERILFLISISAIWTIRIQPGELEKGWCHGQPIKLEIEIECEMKQIYVSIISSTTESGSNYIVQCSPGCLTTDGVKGDYDNSTKILKFNMIFDQSNHTGKYLLVQRSCLDDTEKNNTFLLKPCVSGFTAHALHNNTHIYVLCEHDSFNYSSSGMKIKCNGNECASCLRMSCTTGATALANGVEVISEYKEGMVIMCELDKQVINVTVNHQTPTSFASRETWEQTSPVTGSGERTSESTSPATGSDERTSESTSLATGSDERTSESTSLATGSDERTSESTSLATGSDERTSESTSLATGKTGQAVGTISCGWTNEVCVIIHITGLVLYGAFNI